MRRFLFPLALLASAALCVAALSACSSPRGRIDLKAGGAVYFQSGPRTGVGAEVYGPTIEVGPGAIAHPITGEAPVAEPPLHFPPPPPPTSDAAPKPAPLQCVPGAKDCAPPPEPVTLQLENGSNSNPTPPAEAGTSSVLALAKPAPLQLQDPESASIERRIVLFPEGTSHVDHYVLASTDLAPVVWEAVPSPEPPFEDLGAVEVREERAGTPTWLLVAWLAFAVVALA